MQTKGNLAIIIILSMFGFIFAKDLSFSIQPINDTTILEDNLLIVNLSEHYYDSLSPALSFSAFSDSEKVSCSIESNKLIIRPDSNWYGQSNVIVKVSNSLSQVFIDTFKLCITGVNDPPSFLDRKIFWNIHNTDSLIVNFDTICSDPEQATNTLQFTINKLDGIITNVNKGILTLVPENKLDTTTLTITVTDNCGERDTLNVLLFTNMPQTFGVPFPLIKSARVKYRSRFSKVVYSGQGKFKILSLKGDSLFIDTYNEMGQKLNKPTLVYDFSRCTTSIKKDTVMMSFNAWPVNNDIFIRYTYGYQNTDLNLFIISDTAGNVKYAVSSDGYQSRNYNGLLQIDNNFLLWSNDITSQVVPLYNSNLQIASKLSICGDTTRPRLHIIGSSGGAFYSFWQNNVSSTTVTAPIQGGKMTIQGNQLLAPKDIINMNLLPQEMNSMYLAFTERINGKIIIGINCSPSDGHYQSALYAVICDTLLNPLGSAIKIDDVDTTTKGYTNFYNVNGYGILSWAAVYDPTWSRKYTSKYCIFDSLMNKVSGTIICSDSINNDGEENYIELSDSIVLKISSQYYGSKWATLLKFNSLWSYQTFNQIPRRSKTIPIKTMGRIKYYDIRGRLINIRSTSAEYNRHNFQTSGIYVQTSSDKDEHNSLLLHLK